jgi:hypothetical protein
VWLPALVWRAFYAMILTVHPHVAKRAFNDGATKRKLTHYASFPFPNTKGRQPGALLRCSPV